MNLPKQLSVPLVDIAAQQEEIQEEQNSQSEDIFRRAAFTGGKEVAPFEPQYAEFLRVRHCIGTNNATDASEMALVAGCVLPGQEDIASANTFFAPAETVMRYAIPALGDLDKKHPVLGPASVGQAASQDCQLLGDINAISLPSSAAVNFAFCHLFVIRLTEYERVIKVMRDADDLMGVPYIKPTYRNITDEQQKPVVQTLRKAVSGGLQ